MTKELELKQRQFCEAYLKGLVGKKVSMVDAYLEAYPESTRESAYVSASKLMSHANVIEYIKQRMSDMVMSSNEVLLRLANIAQEAEKDSDKLRALELIGRAQALFLDRTDVTSAGQSISLADYLNGINQAKKNKSGITVVGE